MKQQAFRILMAAGVISLAFTSSVSAQAPVSVKVPFPFVADGVRLPSGTYGVVTENAGTRVQLVRLDGSAPGVLMLTTSGAAVPADSDAAMSFRKVENEYFLAEIRVPGLDARQVPLSPKTIAAELAKVNAAARARINGTR